jgi:hypothetical protein
MKFRPYLFLTLFLFSNIFSFTACVNKSQPPTTQEVLQTAQTAMQQIKAYHFSLTTQNPGSNGLFALTQATGDLLAPDKLQARATGKTLLGSITVQVIALGTQQYITNPLTGSWMPGHGLANASSLADPAEGVAAILRQLKQPGSPHTNNSDGRPCWQIDGTLDPHYLMAYLTNYTEAILSAADPVSVSLCVGKDDHLPYQVQMHGMIIHGDSAQTQRIFTLSRFNENITIQAPSS